MYGCLARLRLEWYGRLGRDLLARHWQWALLATLLVPGAPIVAPFLRFSVLLGAAVAPGIGVAGHGALAAVIELAAVLWIVPQRRAVSGGAFMGYAVTLPVSRPVRLAVEATMLAAANGPLLPAAGLAAARAAVLADGAYRACGFLAVLGLAALAQHAVVTRRLLPLGGVAMGDLLLAMGLDAASPPARWCLLAAALAVAVAGCGGRPAGLGGRWGRRRAGPGAVMFDRRRIVAPALRVQCGILADRPVVSVLRIGAAVGLAMGVARLVALFDFDTRAIPTMIVAVAAIGLLLAGLYCTLSDAHRAAAPCLAALPLPPRYWPLRDTGFLMLVNLVPLAILFRPQGRGLLAMSAGLVVAGQALLVALRWPVLRGGRHRLVLSLVLAAGWSGAAMAAVSR